MYMYPFWGFQLFKQIEKQCENLKTVDVMAQWVKAYQNLQPSARYVVYR